MHRLLYWLRYTTRPATCACALYKEFLLMAWYMHAWCKEHYLSDYGLHLVWVHLQCLLSSSVTQVENIMKEVVIVTIYLQAFSYLGVLLVMNILPPPNIALSHWHATWNRCSKCTSSFVPWQAIWLQPSVFCRHCPSPKECMNLS